MKRIFNRMKFKTSANGWFNVFPYLFVRFDFEDHPDRKLIIQCGWLVFDAAFLFLKK